MRTQTRNTLAIGGSSGDEGSADGQDAGENLELEDSHCDDERSVICERLTNDSLT
jgi:hypothetical protein